jgi:hypothetical protein
MRLLLICALVVGSGILLLIGLWTIAKELYSQSMFGVPFETDGNSNRDDADEEHSKSSSATLIG